MRVVELEDVWRWKCPECDEVNISGMIPAELSMDERHEVMEDCGIDVRDTDLEFFVRPRVVTCLRCFEEFATDVDEDEDEDGGNETEFDSAG